MTTPDALDEILDFLNLERGVAFGRYRRAGLERRVKKRLAATRMADYGAYLDYVKQHPEELSALFDVLLINVTSFFRDPETWEALRQDILPTFLTARPHAPLRAWSAGCATGEEAYSIAIVLCELLGEEQMVRRVKIYATDMDDDALQRARRGTYTERAAGSIPPPLRAKYLLAVEGRYEIRSTLRRCVVFGRHDLMKDPPLSRIDLLACRNTLMYLNAETQAKALRNLRFALRDGAILMLGRAEGILADKEGFTPLNLKRRIFAARGGLEARPSIYPPTDRDPAVLPAAYDAGANAQIVVDSNGALLLANARARETFMLGALDLGRPIQQLEFAYEPMNLRDPIEKAYGEGREVLLKDVPRKTFGFEPTFFDVQITPLRAGKRLLGAQLTFTDVTERPPLRRELRHANAQVETACSELQATGEELETTNEELEAALEELETANEELTSTNDMLEASNDDLAARNEELNARNDALQARTRDVEETNQLLAVVVASLSAAVVVVDHDARILYWNREAADLWGIPPEAALGKSWGELTPPPPVELGALLRIPLGGGSPLERVEVMTDGRGASVRMRVTVGRLKEDGAPRSVLVARRLGGDRERP